MTAVLMVVRTHFRLHAATPASIGLPLLVPIAFGIVAVASFGGPTQSLMVGVIAVCVWEVTLLTTFVVTVQERRWRTLPLLVVGPGALTTVLFGRLLAVALQSLVSAPLVYLVIVVLWRPVPVDTSLPAVAALLSLVLGFVALSGFLAGFLARHRVIPGMLNGIAPLVIALSGLLVPVHALPKPLDWLSLSLPSTWSMQALRSGEFAPLWTSWALVAVWLLASAGYISRADHYLRRHPNAYRL